MDKMKEDLLKIINHYGVSHQQRQLAEEIFELQEAITQHELKNGVSYEIPLTELIDTKEHIAEEIADVMVLLNQFKAYYEIPNETIFSFMRAKINRQLERIKEND